MDFLLCAAVASSYCQLYMQQQLGAVLVSCRCSSNFELICVTPTGSRCRISSNQHLLFRASTAAPCPPPSSISGSVNLNQVVAVSVEATSPSHSLSHPDVCTYPSVQFPMYSDGGSKGGGWFFSQEPGMALSAWGRWVTSMASPIQCVTRRWEALRRLCVCDSRIPLYS